MRTLDVDIETFSSVDLSKCGVYRYCESDDFEILLFGYSVDGGEINVVDLASGEELPDKIRGALTDPSVIKTAHNAAFERICLSRWLGMPTGQYLPPSQWRCTMTWAAYMGLPLSLEAVGGVLGLEKQKLKEGRELVRYFCTPCKPTKSNGGRTRNLPSDAPDKWETFKAYNKRDVETEIEIAQKLSKFPVPDFVWEEYFLSEEINDRGVLVDTQMVEQAVKLDAHSQEALAEKIQSLTGISNPRSVQQMREWLSENGIETDSLDKKAVNELLKTVSEPLRTVLLLRQEIAKSAVKKYQAVSSAACSDGRCRGMFQFYGANRTGRFCLAEGTRILVKTKSGLIAEKPIEHVTRDDMVWDGDNWVHHEGVVYSGDKNVIEWDGVVATGEHNVYIDSCTKITLAEARERKIPLWKQLPRACSLHS